MKKTIKLHRDKTARNLDRFVPTRSLGRIYLCTDGILNHFDIRGDSFELVIQTTRPRDGQYYRLSRDTCGLFNDLWAIHTDFDCRDGGPASPWTTAVDNLLSRLFPNHTTLYVWAQE